MEIRQLDASEGKLTIDQEVLQEADLVGPLQLLVQKGEIRIVRDVALEEEDALDLLDELAGCLGQESAEDYDFNLKIGGLYEAR